MPQAPPNAYQPGTRLTVGSHNVSIIKYISQGGFAHVYTCKIDPPFRGSDVACLKRVAVPSKWQLNLLRQEVDAMKRLRGNPTIVSYIDSHASRMNDSRMNDSNGGNQANKQQYEVFLLMEYCSNNGLIDFMNTRLTNKLTEPEILVIMKDITLAVSMCHHLQPPLIHRDIKIENVLLDEERTYKLCDFGSAVPYSPVPKNPQEFNSLHEDIMQHTTPQYRAPEMIELSRGFPIDDKLDIWALGCFLYKLCYYTTPFELLNHSSLQDLEQLILNCNSTLKIPHNMAGSIFSPRLKNIIKCCLREDPRRRPNSVQLLEEICNMMGIKVPNHIPASVLEKPSIPQQPQQQQNNLLKSSYPSLSQQIQNSQSTPQLPIRKTSNKTNNDPFASIDKSKLLSSNSNHNNNNSNNNNNSHILSNKADRERPKSTYGQLQQSSSRPESLYERNILPTGSNTGNVLKDYIQKQLSKSSENISRQIDDDEDTLNFLKTKEDEAKYGLTSNDTGGSFTKFKHGLRKISTGNSSTGIRSSNNTGNNNYISNKRSSISSIKQLLTGGNGGSGSRKVSNDYKKEEDYEPKTKEKPKPPKKLSIQRRMAQYLNSQEDQTDVKKTALGYGRYTNEESDTDDLEAINSGSYHKRKHLKPPKVPNSLSSTRSISPPVSSSSYNKSSKHSHSHSSSSSNSHSHGHGFKNHGSSHIPSSESKSGLSKITSSIPNILLVPKVATTQLTNKKAPPPKPKKPIHLRTPETTNSHERKLSDSSEISIPDLDDLEKQFAKRFPSYV